MKDFIRQWLCRHEHTRWISSRETYIRSIQTKDKTLVRSISNYICDDCDKLMKIDTGELLEIKLENTTQPTL